MNARANKQHKQLERCVIILKVLWLKHTHTHTHTHTCIPRSFLHLQTFLDRSPPPLGVPMHDPGLPVVMKVQNNILDENLPKLLHISMHTHDPVSLLRHKLSDQLKVNVVHQAQS